MVRLIVLLLVVLAATATIPTAAGAAVDAPAATTPYATATDHVALPSNAHDSAPGGDRPARVRPRQATGWLSDVTVTAAPTVAHQPASWTVEATVTRDSNVTRVDLAFPNDSAVEDVSPEAVRLGYTPPVNATFVMLGHLANVSTPSDDVLRLTVPDGVALEDGSRLTVHVDGVRVPSESANVSLDVSTPDGRATGSDRVEPAPVPHLQFYRSFPEPGVHLRFGLPAGVSMFAVVMHDGDVVGVEHLAYDYAMTADGQPIDVQGVSGEVDLTVRGYYDVNGDGVFDPDVDRPYVGPDGEPIGETATVDLGGTTRAKGTSTTASEISTETTTSVATDATPTQQVETPGFGIGAALAALACLGLLGRG